MVRILVSTSARGTCSSSLAGHYQEYLQYHMAVGDLMVSTLFTVQDLVLLPQRFTAFQGGSLFSADLT